jgi:ABC-type bacteriocin/lantibiotic exporter with double-glycine peptidase domain
MMNIQEKAQNLIQERNELIARFNEINGALKTLDELVQAETEQETETETTTEEES